MPGPLMFPYPILAGILAHGFPDASSALELEPVFSDQADGLAHTPINPKIFRIPRPIPTPNLLNLRRRSPQYSLATLEIK
jgi:hypothetical protein